jgi:hypothetical protein
VFRNSTFQVELDGFESDTVTGTYGDKLGEVEVQEIMMISVT